MPSFFRTPLTVQHTKEKTHTLSQRRNEFVELSKQMDDLLNKLEYSYINFIRQVNSGEKT